MLEVMKEIGQLAKDNPFLSGGAAVALFSFGANYLRGLPSKVTHKLNDFLFLSIRIEKNTRLFTYLDNFIDNKKMPIKHGIAELVNGAVGDEIKIRPYHGPVKRFIFENSLVLIHKDVPNSGNHDAMDSKSAFMGELSNLMKTESYILQFLTVDREIGVKFLTKLVEENKAGKQQYIDLYDNQGASWNYIAELHKRSMTSIITKDDFHYKLLEDIKHFEAEEARYLELGIPHHRGYLLSGSPGNGKSSILHALASALDRSIYVLDLASIKENIILKQLFTRLEANSLVFIEDIDCAFNNRQLTVNGQDSEDRLTFSGLLNALDGLQVAKGTVCVYTTNHIEKLDPALLRPGRIDRIYEVGNATADQAIRLFIKFFGQEYEREAYDFARHIPDGKYNMATLQEYLIRFMYDPKGAADNVTSIEVH
jgi:hypothetical protein